MSGRKNNFQVANGRVSEELISIRDYMSSDDLKNEIRRRISERVKQNWQFQTLSTRGGFIALLFKH
ncbi:hypothetical protein GWO43_20060 [candidate division KSB1 bacterium]|nr:hypothetical protein [candidate division KSB1 bacterium]NIR71567.1 hypothetical protein [candidate division KSB1 bacterium]NIS26363.1 hypothetical protein [candidate division KSB1 bacterium]NIT73130.1 hypothetical protein [candidate division KSB1 bacterium]NIU27046.1 hypothetical protein [candidate division KSB1 bacterium]